MNRKVLDPRLWFSGRGRDRALLAIGTIAPSWTATAHDGTTFRSEDLKDKKYVLWFYPAAETPHCTKQGCGFRDLIQQFKDQGVQVFGVSFDSIEDNRKFAEKYYYNFPLLSDTNRTMGVALGAADKRDTKYARRIGYVIENGKITHAYDVKDAAHHAEQVLKDVRTRP